VKDKFFEMCEEAKKIFPEAKRYETEEDDENSYEFRIIIDEEYNEKVKNKIISAISLSFWFSGKISEIITGAKVYCSYKGKIIENTFQKYVSGKDFRYLSSIRYRNTILKFLKNKKEEYLNKLKEMKDKFIENLEEKIMEKELEILCEKLDCEIYPDNDGAIKISEEDFNNDRKVILQMLKDERFQKAVKELKKIMDEYKLLARI